MNVVQGHGQQHESDSTGPADCVWYTNAVLIIADKIACCTHGFDEHNAMISNVSQTI